MNFAGILILTALVLVGGILIIGLGYAIFAPVTAESIRKLKKDDFPRIAHFQRNLPTA